MGASPGTDCKFQTSTVKSAQQWQSLLGSLTSMERLVHLGMLHLRVIQHHFRENWQPSVDRQSDPVPVPREVKESLSWWTLPRNIKHGVSLHKLTLDYRIFTDALTQGWGRHWIEENDKFKGYWSQDQVHLHINVFGRLAV